MKNLSFDELKGSIAMSLITDQLFTNAIKNNEMPKIQLEKAKIVDKYDEETIRAFASFKIGLMLKLSKERNQLNTDNELFEGFCTAYNHKHKYFVFDDKFNKFRVVTHHSGIANDVLRDIQRVKKNE